MKNRTDKIKFLNGLQSGSRTIGELLPPRWLLKIDLGDRIVYRSNGEQISQEEYKKQSTRSKRCYNITLEL